METRPALRSLSLEDINHYAFEIESNESKQNEEEKYAQQIEIDVSEEKEIADSNNNNLETALWIQHQSHLQIISSLITEIWQYENRLHRWHNEQIYCDDVTDQYCKTLHQLMTDLGNLFENMNRLTMVESTKLATCLKQLKQYIEDPNNLSNAEELLSLSKTLDEHQSEYPAFFGHTQNIKFFCKKMAAVSLVLAALSVSAVGCYLIYYGTHTTSNQNSISEATGIFLFVAGFALYGHCIAKAHRQFKESSPTPLLRHFGHFTEAALQYTKNQQSPEQAKEKSIQIEYKN